MIYLVLFGDLGFKVRTAAGRAHFPLVKIFKTDGIQCAKRLNSTISLQVTLKTLLVYKKYRDSLNSFL